MGGNREVWNAVPIKIIDVYTTRVDGNAIVRAARKRAVTGAEFYGDRSGFGIDGDIPIPSVFIP